jgi:L-ascorbate metabolism protein UlaG (beta-lactamase superfamily)
MIAKVTYVHQSSFLVETGSASLLFDFSGGIMPIFSEGKDIYVVITEKNPEHYSKFIYSLSEQYPNVRYLISSDVPMDDVPELVQEKTAFLTPNMTWNDGVVALETFGEDGKGLSIWCHVDGVDIYHSGDLNNWYWSEGKGDPEAKKLYDEVLEKLAGRHFDIAFIPVDPRLGDDYYRGLDDFMKKADASHIFPMHFWYDYSVIDKVKALPCSEAYRDRIANIESEDDYFVF